MDHRPFLRRFLVVPVSVVVFAALFVTAPLPERAQAAFPGSNGRILYAADSSGDGADIFSTNPDGSGVQQLTSEPGTHLHARWSPDGQQIVYLGPGGDLRIMNSDGSGTTGIAPGLFVSRPAWSPAGDRIAFFGDAGPSGGPQDIQVFVMNANGSGGAQVTDFNPSGGGIGISALDLDWSNTDRIVWASVQSGLHVMNANGSGLTRLADGVEPNWSPDGTKIVFNDFGQLTTMNSNGSGAAPLGVQGRSPAFSPDGTQITFLTFDGSGISIMNADGSGIHQIIDLTGTSTADGPDWGSNSPTGPPPTGSFVDDDDSVFESDIEWMAAAGITKGCNPPTNNRFCPDSVVTRGQMAAFLVRALNLTDRLDDPFIDDDDSIFEADIEKLAAAGITKGCNPSEGNTKFCPDGKVTREQMAAFLVRALHYTDDGGGDLFTDDDDSIFEGDIDRLGTAGVTKGCNPPTNDRYCPSGSVTRGQMSAFLHRALG